MSFLIFHGEKKSGKKPAFVLRPRSEEEGAGGGGGGGGGGDKRTDARGRKGVHMDLKSWTVLFHNGSQKVSDQHNYVTRV